MARIVNILLFLFWTINSIAQEKLICISIDDVPAVTYGPSNNKLSKEITNRLIETFDKYKIPAIGFVNEIQLYRNGIIDSSRIELLRAWVRNGYDLGNHTFSHIDFNKASCETFCNDIIKGEIVTRTLLNEYGDTLKYFRHPYLHLGTSKSKVDSLNTFLETNHYQTSPVTIDTDDYLFAKAYHIANTRQNDSLMRAIGQSYVDYMEQKLIYFEQKSREVLGGTISHTLLIHSNLLNAHYLGEVSKMYIKHGYTFVSQKKVLEDKVYKHPVTVPTPRGISWIFRWGMSDGKGSEIMKGEIEPPLYIKELAKIK